MIETAVAVMETTEMAVAVTTMTAAAVAALNSKVGGSGSGIEQQSRRQ
jgi:hypothetical protein